MCYEKPDFQRINNEALFTFAQELFAKGKSVKIVVAGNSMYPFIRHDRDMVTLAGTSFDKIKVSDIVLAYRAKQKKYILHRVAKITPHGFYMVGDAQKDLDGPYQSDSLIGVVTEIFRVDKNGNEKRIAGKVYKLLVRLWMIVRPFRPLIFKIYFFVRGKMSG